MSFSYNPLWKLLIDKGMTKKELMEATGLSKSTLSKMHNNKYVSMDILDRLCDSLDCNVNDIISHERVKY
jgi:putative transcriptional regulator